MECKPFLLFTAVKKCKRGVIITCLIYELNILTKRHPENKLPRRQVIKILGLISTN